MMMSFVLPKKYNLQTAPRPTNSKIKIKIIELKNRKRLVYQFSGVLNSENTKDAQKELYNFADLNKIKIDKETFMSAGYNPPWTIPWFRRNEVFVDISS